MIRSTILNIVLFLSSGVFVLFGVFFLGCSEAIVYKYWFCFSRMYSWIAKNVGGIDYKIENPENMQVSGSVIYAIRHESMWETLALIRLFEKPVFVMKKELGEIPIFGLLAAKVHSIFVDREQGAKALIDASRKVTEALQDNRQVIIFPEGSRMPTGQYVPLKRGIALFYKKNNCQVIPVIHNSGKFWARRSFKKNTGTVIVRFMPPIPAGLPQDEFMERLDHIFHTEIEKLSQQEN